MRRNLLNFKAMEPGMPETCMSSPENRSEQGSWSSVFIHGRLLRLLNSLKESSNSEMCDATIPGGIASKPPSSDIKINDPSHPKGTINEEQPKIQAFTRRFWILLLYSICSMLNNFQSVKYSSAADIVTCYYDQSNENINWTIMIFMLAYIILAFPSMWFLDRYGIRITVLLGSLLNTICTLIQCVSSKQDGFPIVMVSQTLSAIAMPLLLPIPSSLANTWFKSTEVCRASGVAAIGFQMGGGLAFITTPLFLQYSCSETELIFYGLNRESYFIAACNFMIFVLLLLTFEDKPLVPPSLAEATRVCKSEYTKSIKRLLKNINFDLLLLVYGITIGLFYTINALVNQMLIILHPDSRSEIGWTVQLAYVAGAIGMVMFGYILDITHQFRVVSIIIAWLSALSMWAFTAVIFVNSRWLQYVPIVVIGFFSMSYVSVGFELACEIVYPEPEGSSSGLLSASTMVFSIITTTVGSYLLESYGNLPCALLFSFFLLLSSIVSGFIKCDCKRTKQNMVSKTNGDSQITPSNEQTPVYSIKNS